MGTLNRALGWRNKFISFVDDNKSHKSELDHIRRDERAKREKAYALQGERRTGTKLAI